MYVETDGMLRGTTELPDAPPNCSKTIIFTKYDEPLKKIAMGLSNDNIRFEVLSGTCSKIDSIKKEFNSGDIDVLLINGEKYSSGLNFQNATNLVFYHKKKYSEVYFLLRKNFALIFSIIT